MKRLLTILTVIFITVFSGYASETKNASLTLQTSFETLTSWGTVGLLKSEIDDFTDTSLADAIADSEQSVDKITLEVVKSGSQWVGKAEVYLYYYAVVKTGQTLTIKVNASKPLVNSDDSSDKINFFVAPVPVPDKWDGGRFAPANVSSSNSSIATEASAGNSNKVRAKGLCVLTLTTVDLSGQTISSSPKIYTGEITVSIATS